MEINTMQFDKIANDVENAVVYINNGSGYKFDNKIILRARFVDKNHIEFKCENISEESKNVRVDFSSNNPDDIMVFEVECSGAYDVNVLNGVEFDGKFYSRSRKPQMEIVANEKGCLEKVKIVVSYLSFSISKSGIELMSRLLFESNLLELQKNISRQESNLLHYRKQLGKIKANEKRLKNRNQKLKEKNSAIRNSRSWRVTKGLRKIREVFSLRSISKVSEKIDSFEMLYKEVREDDGIVHFPDKIQSLDKDRDINVLLISHEMSLTGAPIALMNTAEQLLELGYMPLILSPRDGELTKTAVEKKIPVIVYENLYNSDLVTRAIELFDFIVVNTIVPHPVIKKLNGQDIPVCWWIHESEASYNDAFLRDLPLKVSDNIKIFCVGSWARKMINRYRPNYAVDEFFYYVPDYCQETLISDIEELSEKNEKIVFAVVGTIEHRKGQDVFVKAIKSMSPEIVRRCLFVFLGKSIDFELKGEVDNLISLYPENVKYIKRIDRDKVKSFYRQIDCLVCSSRDDPAPTVVTEAMMLSVPVICSENTGLYKLISDNNAGSIYYQNNHMELADCLEKMIYCDERERKLMTENARRVYENTFSKEVFREQLVSMIKKIGVE